MLSWIVALVLLSAVAVGLARTRFASRIRRTSTTMGLSSRAAARWVVHRAREIGKDDPEREKLRTAYHMRTAEDVANTMGQMKGAAMKLAQMASYVDAGLPEPYRAALATLLEGAPPMAYELAAQVVAEELGEPPERAFASFDREPLAAASIGQVHAARLHDGRDVVVKVQYPGVAEAMRADIDNVDLMYRMLKVTFPGLEPGPMVAELRARLGEELDYRLELANQQRFLDLYRGHPFVRVPDVVPERSGRRVITMERIHGLGWRDAQAAPADIRNLWGEAIYRFVFRTFYRARLFNGDPHPGNYRFLADGSVAFLDYGCVKTFTQEALDGIKRLVFAAIASQGGALRTELVGQGFLRPDDDATPERLVAWFQVWYRPILKSAPFTMTREYAEESVRSNVDPSTEWADLQKRFNMPAEYVLLNRINLGLVSILAGLETTCNWRALCEEFWHDAPPSTELGRRDAEYRAARGLS